jgi:phage terminase Nu1 subunit (DNA packaging protein)
MKGDGRFAFNRVDAAAVLGIDVKTLDAWVEQGLPVAVRAGRGRESQYDVRTVIGWVRARDADHFERHLAAATQESAAEQARRRRLAALAKTAEFDLAVKRGRYLPVSDIVRTWTNICAAIRARVLAIPRAVAERVVVEARTGPAAVDALLTAEVRDALRELAAWEPPKEKTTNPPRDRGARRRTT